jgi:hypothetical protein
MQESAEVSIIMMVSKNWMNWCLNENPIFNIKQQVTSFFKNEDFAQKFACPRAIF